MHEDGQIKMVAHQAEAQQIHEIDPAQLGNGGHQVIFFNILKREAVQGGPGHDVACQIECRKAQRSRIQLG